MTFNRNEQQRQWRLANRKKVAEYRRQYHLKHREEQLEYMKQRRLNMKPSIGKHSQEECRGELLNDFSPLSTVKHSNQVNTSAMKNTLLNDYEEIRLSKLEHARLWGDYYRALANGIRLERPTYKVMKIIQTPGYDNNFS